MIVWHLVVSLVKNKVTLLTVCKLIVYTDFHVVFI